MHDLIIIGGGAAALSSAVYALGKRLDMLVIYEDLDGKAGTRQHISGQVVEEFLAGVEAIRSFERYVRIQAGHTLRDRVVEVSKTDGAFQVMTAHHGIYESLAVIVATGATPLTLDVPGARELLGQGLGYSATTHAHLLAGKTAAVIGTTVRALRGAVELARMAAKVYLIAPDDDNLATPLAARLRERSNVEMLEGYTVREIVGEISVEELVIERAGQTVRLHVDAAFIDVGLSPNSEIVRELVQTDSDGFIWVDDCNATSVPGLFAAGDVTTSFGEQIM